MTKGVHLVEFWLKLDEDIAISDAYGIAEIGQALVVRQELLHPTDQKLLMIHMF